VCTNASNEGDRQRRGDSEDDAMTSRRNKAVGEDDKEMVFPAGITITTGLCAPLYIVARRFVFCNKCIFYSWGGNDRP
jgi:hypothetical protein